MRTRSFLTVLAFLLIGSMASAADFIVPKQQIVGADKPIPLGELVSLSVSQPSTAPHLASTSYEWKVFDGAQEKRFAVDANGNVFFGAGLKAKKLLAVVAATHLYVVKDGEQVKQVATKTVLLTAPVVIGDEQPTPPDEPTPPQPDPEPTFPAGKYQLSKFVWEIARDKVNPAGRAEAARKMSVSFRKVSVAISAGTMKDAAVILKSTKQYNDAALGKDARAWDQFGEALQERLLQLFEAGSLKYPDDFVAAWNEIAAGLDAVK